MTRPNWIPVMWLIASSFGSCSAQPTGKGPRGEVREPAVAGQFYPASASALKLAVQSYISDAVAPRTERPIAIVAPHAGYIYSGQIAADAYRQCEGQRYGTVVILGTNHTTPDMRKIAVYPGTGFRTPLGIAPVDSSLVDALVKESPDCALDGGPHAREHSVEVQVPFIQSLFPDAKIVPLVVGTQDLGICTRFGKALGKLLSGRQALIIASSDLSHYPAYDAAVRADKRTLEAIAAMDPEGFVSATDALMRSNIAGLGTCACGSAPIIVAMSAAKALGATRGVVVSYANSGDVAVGDSSRVVGYGAVVFTSGAGGADTTVLNRPTTSSSNTPFSREDKLAMLAFARKSIQRFVESDTLPLARNVDPRLLQRRGCFVTLKKHGELRGCIGHMLPDVPLYELVGTMALHAAFNDTRFEQLRAAELPEIEIEISVLTPPGPVSSAREIVVGRDGVILTKGSHSAVFLPQVATEQGWDRDEMLDHLCSKAGLSPGEWKQGAGFQTFQAEVFSEADN